MLPLLVTYRKVLEVWLETSGRLLFAYLGAGATGQDGMGQASPRGPGRRVRPLLLAAMSHPPPTPAS